MNADKYLLKANTMNDFEMKGHFTIFFQYICEKNQLKVNLVWNSCREAFPAPSSSPASPPSRSKAQSKRERDFERRTTRKTTNYIIIMKEAIFFFFYSGSSEMLM